MAAIAIQKVSDQGKTPLPIFEEIGKRIDNIQRRAFELFEGRGAQIGRDLDDWLQAEREINGSPAASLTETDGIYKLEVALPGLEAKDVDVTATPAEIIVHACSQHEKRQEQKEDVVFSEFDSRELYRRQPLLESIDPEQVEANLVNGLLTITAPKSAKAVERKVAVKGS